MLHLATVLGTTFLVATVAQIQGSNCLVERAEAVRLSLVVEADGSVSSVTVVKGSIQGWTRTPWTPSGNARTSAVVTHVAILRRS
jgi:hypothetical protein